MKLALIGYGKMGRMVEELALARGHQILFKIDIEGNEQGQALTAANLKGVEVALDFSIPDAVVRNVGRLHARRGSESDPGAGTHRGRAEEHGLEVG